MLSNQHCRSIEYGQFAIILNKKSRLCFLANLRFIKLLDTVFPVELIDTSAGCSSFLRAGVERMALGAYFDVDLRLRGTCYKCVPAVAGYGCLIIFRLDRFFHFFTSFIMFVNCLRHTIKCRPFPVDALRQIPFFHRSRSPSLPELPLQVPAVGAFLAQREYYSMSDFQMQQKFFRSSLFFEPAQQARRCFGYGQTYSGCSLPLHHCEGRSAPCA